MTVVIDTNVFLAAAFWRGTGSRCWALCVSRGYPIAVSDDILGEYCRKAAVLSEEFPEVDPGPFLRWIETECPHYEPSPLGNQRSRDASDDMFLACALASKASFLITRDADLLALRKPFGITIITDDEFLKLFKQAGIQFEMKPKPSPSISLLD